MGAEVGAARLIAVAVAAVLVVGCGGAATRQTSPPTTSTAVDSGSAPVVVHPPVPAGPRTAPVPILMYHVVASAPPGTPFPELWVPPQRFRLEIRALAHAGFHATTLDAVWRAWHGRGRMPRKPIVVSFDDGYRSQSTTARRMLNRLGWPGVLNLEVNNVRRKGGIRRGEVRAMMRDGWEIDAHTLTHPDLTTVDAAQLHREVAGSRAWVRHAFGVPVHFFAYPAGRYNATVEAAVRKAGYRGAVTTDDGIASHHDDPFALPRIRVMPETTPQELLARVRALERS
jgi:peptidoglycan/xylan/chitin deacetylase (PgdA/CDA1 family)